MNKQYLSFIVHFAVAWLLCTSPVLAQINVDTVSESIVRVRAYDNHKVVVEGSGFVINKEGYVLTNAHLTAKADGLTVLSLKTGAEVVAQRVFASRSMNLALLHVQGLNLPPLSLSEQGVDVDAEDEGGYTPLHVAMEYNASATASVLRRYGGRE